MDASNLAPAALRTFFRIAEVWGLSGEEQRRLLGSPSAGAWSRWRRADAVELPPEALERLSYLFGIYGALKILLPHDVPKHGWLHRSNGHPLFGGRPPLEFLLSGDTEALRTLRRYLDAQAGGDWGSLDAFEIPR